MILKRICSQKEGGNKDVQEAEFLNQLCTLTKDLGVLLHLDLWSINILKARTAKYREKPVEAVFKFKLSNLEHCETTSTLTENFEKVQHDS